LVDAVWIVKRLIEWTATNRIASLTVSIVLLTILQPISLQIEIPLAGSIHFAWPALYRSSPAETDPYVTMYPISQNSSDYTPFVLNPASDKTVWVVTFKQGNIINNVVQPPRAQIVNYTIGIGAKPVITLVNAIPSDIVYDQTRKRVWFLENDSLAYFDRSAPPANMTIERTFPRSSPQFMTIDPSGRIWVTLLGTNQIAEYDPSTRQSPRLYNAPAPNASLQGITIAPDGTVWFAETVPKRIGHLIPCESASCTITDYGPPRGVQITFPIQLAVDLNGAVWFTDHGSNQFGSFNPSTLEWRVFPIGYCSASFADCAAGLPNAIFVDSSGKIWFSEHYAGRVARYDPSNGTLIEYAVPATTPPYIWWASPGPGNLVWFVAFGLGEIGYVNASLPIPISISAMNSTELEQGGSMNVLTVVHKLAADHVYLNVSANSNDAPLGLSPLLYGSSNKWQIGPSDTVVSTVFRLSAAWTLGLRERYVALTAYTNNIAVSVFVRVDVVQAKTPYFSTVLASTIAIGSVALYWRYVPKKSKKYPSYENGADSRLVLSR
jgi:streptogramin lyase